MEQQQQQLCVCSASGVQCGGLSAYKDIIRSLCIMMLSLLRQKTGEELMWDSVENMFCERRRAALR